MLIQSKTHDAYKFLKDYDGPTDPNNFRFLSWLKDGKALTKSNPVDGYVLQSFAYSLLGEADLALQTIKNAAALGSDIAKLNYAITLGQVGELELSSKIALDLLKQNPLDEQAFLLILQNADFSLDDADVKKAHHLFKKDFDIHSSLDYIFEKNQLLNELSIKKSTFLSIIKSLFYFIAHHYHGNYQVNLSKSTNEIWAIIY